MSGDIKISVDGDDGAVVAQNPLIRIVNPYQDVVRSSDDQNGAYGENARTAVRGAPAGLLAVELSESNIAPDGIHARVIRQASRQRPPPSIEVPAKRNVLFTAIGGAGENGHTGGDGQPGRNGVNGERATRSSDATGGTNGGDGGSAGEGTNGADGGDGGQIELYVDEDDTHLLFAADWDVRGGLGGAPGVHGQPGKGGIGGKGGEGITWEELLGYRFECTPRCIGVEERSTDNSPVRYRDGAASRALAPAISQQVVQGGNLQALIARAAAQYGVLRYQREPNNTGNCKCAGGRQDISCVGCEPVPIYQTYKRIAALDGRDGRPGQITTAPLSRGWVGQAGTGTIIVRMRDGTQENYNSKYDLELVDFDVEDGNGDGIFEPGEYAYVRRIRIRNNGGMPSPTCRIPITLNPSTWFEPVLGTEAIAFIPPSIRAGEMVTLRDALKLRIKQNDTPFRSGTQFLEQDVLSVSAQMPWLHRALPNFEHGCFIDVQYPIALRGFDCLASLAQGSTSCFTFEVYNRSTRALGLSSQAARAVEIIGSVDADFGHLQMYIDEWQDQVTRNVPITEPLDVSLLSQRIRIFPDAQSYRHVEIAIGLYLADPIQDYATAEPSEVEKRLIQQMNLSAQIAPHHKFDANSAFLLVTTSKSTRPRVQAIQKFIREDLKMKLDEWNISLYGGFQYPAEEDQDQPVDVTVAYQGKSIIFLGDRFEFFGTRDRSIAEFCEVRVLTEATIQGTSCLFLGSSGDKALKDLLGRLVFPVPLSITELARRMNDSQKFGSRKDLTESIIQSKVFQSLEIQVYAVPIEGRWYRLGGANPESEAKKFARYLRQHLPQERFLVAPTEEIRTPRPEIGHQQPTKTGKLRKTFRMKHSEFDRGGLVVLHGCSHEISAMATERHPTSQANIVTPTSNNLPPFEALMLVQSLPISKRIDMLWNFSTDDTTDLEDQCSENAMNCVSFSILIRVNQEIQTFLKRATWPNEISFPKGSEASEVFIRVHLPILHKLLQYPAASNPTKPPERFIEILRYASASCLPQKKRHVMRATLLPLSQRRTQLRKLLKSTFTAFLQQRSYNEEEITNFHKDAKSLHSHSDSQRRVTEKVILKCVGAFTKKTEHEYKKGHRTASRVVPRTTYCTAQEWRDRWQGIEDARAKIGEETQSARLKLGKMILDAPRGDES